MLGFGSLGQHALGQSLSGQGATVDVAAIDLAVTALAPSISVGAVVLVPVGGVAVAGAAPVLAGGASLAAPSATVTITALAPVFPGSASVDVPVASVLVTALAPDVTIPGIAPPQTSGFGGGGGRTTFVETESGRRRLDARIKKAISDAQRDEREIAKAYDKALGLVVEEEVTEIEAQAPALSAEELERLIFEIEVRMIELLRLKRWEEEAIVLLLTA